MAACLFQRTNFRIALLSAGFAVAGCGTASTPKNDVADMPMDGHERMVARLHQIRSDTPKTNSYLGDGELVSLRKQLSLMPAWQPVIQRMMLLANIAKAELFQGKNREAVATFKQALALSEPASRSVPRQHRKEFDKIHKRLIFDLAVAWFRVGETENCIHCQTGESCILPIGPAGVHQQKEGAQEAIRVLTELLTQDADNYGARWLLNLATMTVGHYPDGVPEAWRIPEAKFRSTTAFPHFDNIAADVGLNTLDLSGGVIIEDFDNDGWLDIVTSTWDTSSSLHYFKNNGDGSFTERTQQAGLKDMLGGLNMIQADYDNDGHTDIYVLRGAWLKEHGRHPNSLLRNLGGGKFRDVTHDVGLADPALPTHSAAWSDFDNDGHLDLFVGVEGIASSQLFHNQGNGTFVDVAKTAGVGNDRFVRGCSWGDYDNDRRPDLYVSNLSGENRLYHNDGGGQFTDVAIPLNVRGPVDSFPTWFWDCNNDGHLDLFVSSYSGSVDDVAKEYFGQASKRESPTLYLGNGAGGFQNATVDYGLACVALTMGANFGDVDGDGYLDFYLGTGYPEYEGVVPNLMFRNTGGTGFENVTFESGMGHLQKGHGVALADLDHDGDQDVFIQLGGAYAGDEFTNALFRNPGFGQHWLYVQLVGEQSNRSAIGARIRAVIKDGDDVRSVYSHVNSGGSFGASPLRCHLGLGQATIVQTLEVYWPTSDLTQTFQDVAVNQFIEIHEGRQETRQHPYRPAPFTSKTRPSDVRSAATSSAPSQQRAVD